jgi:hypothetical protein
MVRDSLDETGKGLLRPILGRVFHILDSRNASPNVAMWVSAAISLLSIFGCARSSADGYALVFLCSPLAHLPVASEGDCGNRELVPHGRGAERGFPVQAGLD